MSKMGRHRTMFPKVVWRVVRHIVCPRCKHIWDPLIENPVRCPQCGKKLHWKDNNGEPLVEPVAPVIPS